MSPKDMDFIEAKNAAARDIALALGVPPMLLGIPGDNTYSNYAEARRCEASRCDDAPFGDRPSSPSSPAPPKPSLVG